MLEGRHVIGLFMAVIVLSGLFFTLGYVMGRNQTSGPVIADLREKPPASAFAKPETVSKKPQPASPDSPPETTTPANSDWEFYHAGDRKKPEDRLKPVSSPPASTPAVAKKTDPVVVKTKAAPSLANNNSSKRGGSQQMAGPSFILQVAAVRKDADALDLAKRLQQKKFPAFVLSPKTDKYYRVQVGPYSDPKAAEAARTGLEGAGFRAFVKQN